MRRTLVTVLLVAVGFFALYALTAQRGLGWGDSGEFHYRILRCADGLLGGCDSFATAHPPYVALARLVCSTPYQVTLISSFFGALAVSGFLLCSRNVALTVVFGLSHALWWLSCVAEVYTMSLTCVAFETLFLMRFLDSRKVGWLAALALLNGLHLELHNLALLSVPVYAVAVGVVLLPVGARRLVASLGLAAVAWAAGASFWLWALVTRGVRDVLVGSYGGQALGLLPDNWTVAGFNLALSGLSFVAPVAILWWTWRAASRPSSAMPVASRVTDVCLVALLAVHALFFVRYFIISQFTFVLPTVFFAYLLVARVHLGRTRTVALMALQLLVPLFAWQVLSSLPVPAWRPRHKYRDEAKYFALPWKAGDDSADRLAAELDEPWNGYPGCGGKAGAK